MIFTSNNPSTLRLCTHSVKHQLFRLTTTVKKSNLRHFLICFWCLRCSLFIIGYHGWPQLPDWGGIQIINTPWTLIIMNISNYHSLSGIRWPVSRNQEREVEIGFGPRTLPEQLAPLLAAWVRLIYVFTYMCILLILSISAS